MVHRQRSYIYTQVRTHHHHNHHQPFHSQVAQFWVIFVERLLMTSMEVDGAGTSSARRRRRERRLRSWWRHERMSVAAALAEAHHHSAPKVGAETHYALRREKTASAGGRGPGVLKDPAPQKAVTVGYGAALHTVAGGHDGRRCRCWCPRLPHAGCTRGPGGRRRGGCSWTLRGPATVSWWRGLVASRSDLYGD